MIALTLDLLLAIVLLGIPMVIVSWFVFQWLFSTGDVDPAGDRKAITSQLKKIRKTVSKRERNRASYVYDKWMWFGSGFYGLAGLWTFAVIEISQLFTFVVDFPGWNELTRDGLIGFIITFIVNQLSNLLQGLLWFNWWPADSILLWLLVAYLGYWVGVDLARRHAAIRLVSLWTWFKNLN